MKKAVFCFVIFLSCLFFVQLGNVSYAQRSLQYYEVDKGTDEDAWFTLDDYTQIFTPNNCDHCWTATTGIGFDFLLGTGSYSTFYATGDAKLSLGTSAASQGTSNAYSSDYNEPLNNGSFCPKIVAVGRDGAIGSNGYIRTQLFGEAPYRVRVVEYRMQTWSQHDYGNASRDFIFQIQLFETTNTVRIVYGPTPATIPNVTYQIGIRSSDTKVWYVNASDDMLYYAGGTTASRSANTWPGEYKWYSFTPSCHIRSALTIDQIKRSTARVSWSNLGYATRWVVEYGTGEVGAVGNKKDTVTSVTHTMTGLSDGTDYNVYVYAICPCGVWGFNANDTVRSNFHTDCTPVATVSLPWTENFNSFGSDEDKYAPTGVATPEHYQGDTHYQPYCWRFPYMNTTSTTSYPQVYLTGDASLVKGGSGKAMVLRSASSSATASQSAIAALPTFAKNLDKLKVSFDYRNNSSYTSTRLQLGYITGDVDAPTFFQIGSDYPLSESYASVEIDLSRSGLTFPADARLAFRLPSTTSSSTDYYAIIDNIKVDTALVCASVENLAVANITNSSVTLTWNVVAGAQKYVVRTIADGLDLTPVNSRFDTVTTGRLVVTGLTGGTLYHFYVKAQCDATTSGDSVKVSATTYCSNVSLPYFESFNGYAAVGVTDNPTMVPTGYTSGSHALPTCWRFLNLSTGTSTYPQAYMVSAGSADGATYTLGGSGNALILRNDGNAARISYAILPTFTSGLNNIYTLFIIFSSKPISFNNSISDIIL